MSVLAHPSRIRKRVRRSRCWSQALFGTNRSPPRDARARHRRTVQSLLDEVPRSVGCGKVSGNESEAELLRLEPARSARLGIPAGRWRQVRGLQNDQLVLGRFR